MAEITEATARLAVLSRCLTRVPTDFSQLTNLTDLNLEGNVFDTVPREIGSFVKLKKLSLSRNQIAHFPRGIAPSLKCLVELDMSHNKLDSFGGIVEFTSLRIVSLGNNYIEDLPALAPNLTGLQTLSLESNSIMNLPSGMVSSLTDLTELNLDNNKISFLCNNWNLPSLTSLSLNKNKLSDLPSSIKHSNALQHLKIGGNEFTMVPAAISHLENLGKLDAHANKITDVPDWMSDFSKKFEKLGLKGNALTNIPPVFGRMKNLNYLDLSDNKIDKLPLAFGWIPPRLTKINLAGNTLPKEILEAPDVISIKKLVEGETGSMVDLNEYVLMFIGDKHSGKTNLYQQVTSGWTEKVVGIKTNLKRKGVARRRETSRNIVSESKVEDQSKLSFHYVSIRKNTDMSIRRFKFLDKDAVMCVNAWDVSERALKLGVVNHFWTEETILVVALSAQDPNMLDTLRKHLNVIKVSANDPPTIIALTFSDEIKKSSKKVDLLTADIVNLVQEVGGLSNVTIADNIEALKITVQGMIQRNQIPNNWMVLRSYLRSHLRKELVNGDKIPLISKNRLFTTAYSCGITERSEALQCVRKLHRTGSVFYFRQEALADRIFIDPYWLLCLIATPLEFPLKGHWIKFQELETLLANWYPPKQRATCVDVLEEFNSIFIFGDKNNASFRNSGTNSVLVFALAPEQEPPTPRWASLMTKRQQRQMRASRRIEGEIVDTEEVKMDLSTLARLMQFVCLPQGLWLHIVTYILSLLRESGSLSHVLVWENGLQGLIPGKIMSTITIKRNVSDAKAHELILEVASRNLMTARSVFADLVVSLSNEVQTWKSITWHAFAISGAGRLPLDATVDEQIREGNVKMKTNGHTFNFYDIVPERVFIEYQGPRYSLKQLKLDKVLGQGGFAQVFQGTLGERTVAVKVLQDQSGQQAKVAAEDFRKEVFVQSSMKHSNILGMLGICMMPMAIIMEICPYGELEEHINRWDKPLPWPFRIKVAQDIAVGLKYMQDQNPPMAHLDLKSRNILLASLDMSQPCAKICDFGTSQTVVSPLTECNCDNPVYQAPEILDGKPFTESVDIYAYGVILWELLTREGYCANFNYVVDIIQHVTTGNREHIPTFSPPLWTALIKSCWHQNPSRRPTMSWVLSNLSALRLEANKLEATIGVSQAKTLLEQWKGEKGETDTELQGYINAKESIVKFHFFGKPTPVDTEEVILPSLQTSLQRRKEELGKKIIGARSEIKMRKMLLSKRTSILSLPSRTQIHSRHFRKRNSVPYSPKLYWEPTRPLFKFSLIRVTENSAIAVKPSYTSMCESHVFLLDMGTHIIQWNGKTSSPETKSFALKLASLLVNARGKDKTKYSIIYGKVLSASQCSVANYQCSGEVKPAKEVATEAIAKFPEMRHYHWTDAIHLCEVHMEMANSNTTSSRPWKATPTPQKKIANPRKMLRLCLEDYEDMSLEEFLQDPTLRPKLQVPKKSSGSSDDGDRETKWAAASATGVVTPTPEPEVDPVSPARSRINGLSRSHNRASAIFGQLLMTGEKLLQVGEEDEHEPVSGTQSDGEILSKNDSLPAQPSLSSPTVAGRSRSRQVRIPVVSIDNTSPREASLSPQLVASPLASRLENGDNDGFPTKMIEIPRLPLVPNTKKVYNENTSKPRKMEEEEERKEDTSPTPKLSESGDFPIRKSQSRPTGRLASKSQAKTLTFGQSRSNTVGNLKTPKRAVDDNSISETVDSSSPPTNKRTGWETRPKSQLFQSVQDDLEHFFWSGLEGGPPTSEIPLVDPLSSSAPSDFEPRVYLLAEITQFMATFEYMQIQPSQFLRNNIYFINTGFDLVVYIGPDVVSHWRVLFIWDHIELFKKEYNVPHLRARITSARDLLLKFAFKSLRQDQENEK
eukprot:TRINITY_DN9665_c0_g1_i1.p1 TRINITY_DN9665_c0_g1~~TRINITY_DN9665_c0_g1_i1.p1  ORF type:complete len:2176 (+),score=448.20 TRINITY_DN9665_c0_g1_i1:872-6529(+)